MLDTNGSYLVSQTEMQKERYVVFFYHFYKLSLSLFSDKFWGQRRKLHIFKNQNRKLKQQQKLRFLQKFW